MLTDLGLDAAAEVVYRGMLTHPDASLAELGERLDLPEEDIRRAWTCSANSPW
ncbi:hypothetical protein R1T08_03010 [Streptomyces sp. SBC-4]|nr:hypothetical protein [Streptomyces sp. SBC-4]MDV5143304.1 hypothetical protein [Streptomyces sp. SBC-4]